MEKGAILDELCATTGWHRNHARRALGRALVPRVVRPPRPRAPTYGADVVVALRFCWAVLGAPTGKRLAPVMGELVATLRRLGEPGGQRRAGWGVDRDVGGHDGPAPGAGSGCDEVAWA